MASDRPFDLRLVRARDEINEALGQRVPDLGPAPNQQPMQMPGNLNVSPSMWQMPAGAPNPGERFGAPQLHPDAGQPMASRFGGAQVSAGGGVGPGFLSGGAQFSPSGDMQGAGVNYSAPAAGGQINLGANLDDELKLSQLMAEYQRGPFSAGMQYSPSGGVRGGIRYRQAFQEGGLATSLRSDPVHHERDVEFINTRNQHMRELAGRQAYAKGGGAWTRKEGKNPEGGLNALGRASLKAQGHDIKPPVSAKQAKKSPKAAARRKSFCARMSGMPGAMKDEGGKPTRKALALRKWDC